MKFIRKQKKDPDRTKNIYKPDELYPDTVIHFGSACPRCKCVYSDDNYMSNDINQVTCKLCRPDVKFLYELKSHPDAGYGMSFWFETYRVVKETNEGYWIIDQYSYPACDFKKIPRGRMVWVSKTGRSRRFRANKIDAIKSYKARRKKWISIMASQTAYAKESLNRVDTWWEESKDNPNRKPKGLLTDGSSNTDESIDDDIFLDT